MNDDTIRLELIKKLNEIHPGIVNDKNSNIANYMGGMVDDGGLNLNYCLFEASIEELKSTLKDCNKEEICD